MSAVFFLGGHWITTVIGWSGIKKLPLHSALKITIAA
jgi:hypothetical protein